MSQVIRIPSNIYKRLESYAIGFDTPAGVIERLLDFYELHVKKGAEPMETVIQKNNYDTSFSESSTETRSHRLEPLVYNSYAGGRFTRDLREDTYTITSPQGVSKTFKLPQISDKEGIRKLTHEVEDFVEKQGGTIGQTKAARKKLTEFGYHITK